LVLDLQEIGEDRGGNIVAYDPLSRSTHVKQTSLLTACGGVVFTTTFNIRIDLESFYLVGKLTPEAATVFSILLISFLSLTYFIQASLDLRSSGVEVPNEIDSRNAKQAEYYIDGLKDIAENQRGRDDAVVIAGIFSETVNAFVSNISDIGAIEKFPIESINDANKYFSEIADTRKIEDTKRYDRKMDIIMHNIEFLREDIRKIANDKSVSRSVKMRTLLVYFVPLLATGFAVIGALGGLSPIGCSFDPANPVCVSP
jgi:hypothetical protein